jgi:hypothetical protein
MLLQIFIFEGRTMLSNFHWLVADILGEVSFNPVLQLLLLGRLRIAIVVLRLILGNPRTSLVSRTAKPTPFNTVIPINGVRMYTVKRVVAINTLCELPEKTNILEEFKRMNECRLSRNSLQDFGRWSSVL